MNGSYIQDMIDALTEVGIKNSVPGNYSSNMAGDALSVAGDALSVVFNNQANEDPIIFKYGEIKDYTPSGEYEEREYLFGAVKIKKYKHFEHPPSGGKLGGVQIGRDQSSTPNTDFSLPQIGVPREPPMLGQFNLIGYSWGAVIAARTAIYYAQKGTTINNLVLIGAPINKSLLDAAKGNSNIKKLIIINLREFGDPIYPGMTDEEVVRSIFILGRQYITGDGHFYYSGDDSTGKGRRRELAKRLYSEGLR